MLFVSSRRGKRRGEQFWRSYKSSAFQCNGNAGIEAGSAKLVTPPRPPMRSIAPVLRSSGKELALGDDFRRPREKNIAVEAQIEERSTRLNSSHIPLSRMPSSA